MKILKTLMVSALIAGAGFTIFADTAKNMKKLMNAQFAISKFYVDSVSEDKLVEDAIKGMLNQLDPHSTYTSPEETKEMQQPLKGGFSGIGITFNMVKDTLYVISTVNGGPSEKVGILAGDRIIAVNDTTIAGVKMKTNEIRNRLMGKKGTKVNVLVSRPSAAKPIEFGITRDNIPIYSVDASYMLDNKTGYIRISRFAETTAKEFQKAMEKLKKEGMTQLIVDLADNGGGYLQAVIEVANDFLNSGEVIVSTKGLSSPENKATAYGNGKFKDGKLIVLVNQNSASASEILAGAVQDWDRGVIVGRRTFGKGLVQRPFTFADGSMMRLTTARYYTPTGRCIQKPYKTGDSKDYKMDVYNRLKEGELMHADSIHVVDSLKYTTMKNHRTIYGGGGIIPDIFVPVDTTEYSEYYGKLANKGVLIQYALKYVDANRKALKKKYRNADDYMNNFTVTDNMVNDMVTMATSDSIKFNQEQFDTSKHLILTSIKGLIMRDIFEQQDVTRFYNKENKMLSEALKIINDDRRYYEIINGHKD